jgi:hypothetical protein
MNIKVIPIGIFVAAVVLLSGIGWFSRFIYKHFHHPGEDIDPYDSLLILTTSVNAKILITVPVLFAALFVILSRRYAASEKHWAYGAVGTLLGFWLKG